MVADPGGPPIPADYTRPGMTETANDRPAEDAPKASVPPSPGRRNRLAAADARSQRILILVLRAIFVVVLISVVVLTVASNRTSALDFGFSTVVGLLISAAALGLIIITVDALTPNKRLAWVVGIFVGIMIGLVGAVAVGSVIDLVAGAWDLKESSAVYLGLVKVTIGIVLVYLSVSVVLTTRDDLRLVIPYVEFAKQVRGARPLLLDTSVLIDGRFEDLGRTGILDAPVVVAQFVIDELQALADSGDGTKRQRGRRGLDVLQRLQGNPWIDLEIEDFRNEGRSTDRALVEVAKAERFRIVTTDTGLERVAQINGVACLNLNAVATAMRTGQVTGESLRIAVVKRGENPHQGAAFYRDVTPRGSVVKSGAHPLQGLGFREDGTKVVVDHGARRIGETVETVVTNTVQTSAGRLIFARLAEGAEGTAAEAAATDESSASGPRPTEPSTSSMARAATTQPRTPPRPGQEPNESRRPRNPRR